VKPVVSEYVIDYHEDRPHSGLKKAAPVGRSVAANAMVATMTISAIASQADESD
jgi:hypothetical protein